LQTASSPPKYSSLKSDDILALAAYGARTTWPANFQIYQCGGAADGFSVVLRGHVILRNKMRSGRGFVPAVVTVGESFGIEGLATECTYVTDAQAAENTETLFVSTAKFREFVREKPTDALRVLGQLMSERAQVLERLHELASQNVEQRLTSALRRIARDRSFLARDGSLKLEVKHHRLLCEMVGATRESIALALGRLAGSGVARRSGTSFLVSTKALNNPSANERVVTDSISVFSEPMRAAPS
jgi:CRP-like cAMP-binding protein